MGGCERKEKIAGVFEKNCVDVANILSMFLEGSPPLVEFVIDKAVKLAGKPFLSVRDALAIIGCNVVSAAAQEEPDVDEFNLCKTVFCALVPDQKMQREAKEVISKAFSNFCSDADSIPPEIFDTLH